MRFKRLLGPAFFDALSDAVFLGRLVSECRGCSRADPYAFDWQLRENDQLMLYLGTTHPLVVKFRADQSRCVTYVATGAYSREIPEAKDFLGGQFTLDEAAVRWQKHGCRYLNSVRGNPYFDRYYGNGKEGYWQNRLCLRYGMDWTPDDEWLVVDRESVIGFDNEEAKQVFDRQVMQGKEAYSSSIQEDVMRANVWCRPQHMGDEADLLAIGPNRELVCIELKHGSSSEIYWAPIQAALYRDRFEKARTAIGKDIRRLVAQKIALGLLPEQARTRLPPEGEDFTDVRAVLAVAEPNMESQCWQRIKVLNNRFPGLAVSVVLIDPRGKMSRWNDQLRMD
ncbi:MAG: hypothetical protein H7836_12165 [Magnetococcus sp. YQC-3]